MYFSNLWDFQDLTKDLHSDEGNFLVLVAALIHIVVRLTRKNIYETEVSPPSILMAVVLPPLVVPFADPAYIWTFVRSCLDQMMRQSFFVNLTMFFVPRKDEALSTIKILFAELWENFPEITWRSSSSSPLYLLSPPITMMTSPPDNNADWNVKRHNSTYFHTICNFQCFVADQCVCISHVRHT